MSSLVLRLKQRAQELGFSKIGISPAESGAEVERLQQWLAQGYHADMHWMANPKRQNIKLIMPEVKSVISLAVNYYHPQQHSQEANSAKISRYGWGRDYHKVLGKMLKKLCHWLEEEVAGITTRYFVDTAPITEKAWAQRAGIGWIGKHSNLITKEFGSWVFLAEILTNLELPPDLPHPEQCGRCRLCIDACPTQAITQPFVVDANRCIAYHTIENRAEQIPEAIAQKLENWVAGCDICQEVCPYNRRPQISHIADFAPYPANLKPQLQKLAEISDEEWDQQFQGSALRRIKPQQFRRNAQAVLRASNSVAK
jgi:epoxyqueuosine reductase